MIFVLMTQFSSTYREITPVIVKLQTTRRFVSISTPPCSSWGCPPRTWAPPCARTTQSRSPRWRGSRAAVCLQQWGGCPYITSSIKLQLELDICFELIMTTKVFQQQLDTGLTGQELMDFDKISRFYFLQFIWSKSVCSEYQKVFIYSWNTINL